MCWGRGNHGVVSLVLCCFIGLLFWVKFQYYPASKLLPFSYSLRTFNQQYKFIFSVSGSLPSNLYLMLVIPACLESFRLVRNHEERSWTNQDDRHLERLPDDLHQGMVKSRSDREKDRQERTLLCRSQYLEVLNLLLFGTEGGFTQCPVCQRE